MKNITEVQLAVAKIIGRNEFNTNDRIEKLADIMELIKEQLTLTDVVKPFTPTQILKVLDDCNGLIDAKEYFLDENL